jgi:hypothetical protein
VVHYYSQRVWGDTWRYLRAGAQGVCTSTCARRSYTNWTSYVENVITDPELAATQPRIQERIKQVAARNAAHVGGPQWNSFYSSPAPTPLNRLKRVGM